MNIDLEILATKQRQTYAMRGSSAEIKEKQGCIAVILTQILRCMLRSNILTEMCNDQGSGQEKYSVCVLF